MEWFTPAFGLSFFIFFTIAHFGILLWAIIDIIRSNFKENDKLIWILITLFAPFGGLIYLIFGADKKIR